MNLNAQKISFMLKNLFNLLDRNGQEVWLPGGKGFCVFIVCNKEEKELNDFTK